MRRLLTVIALLFLATIGWAKPLEIPKWAKPHNMTEAVTHPFAYYWFGTCGNGYSFHRELKLQKAFGSDLSNFPALIDGQYSYAPLSTAFLTVANGGQVQHTVTNSTTGVIVPADAIVCDSASGGNQLKHEFEKYSASTAKAFILWVGVPTLHSASNDSIHVFVGNSSVSTDQEDLSLWTDANYTLVCHEPDGASLNVACSVGSTASTTGSGTTAVAGKIDGAASFNGSGGINTGKTQSFTAMTLEVWVKTGATGTYRTQLSNLNGSGTDQELLIRDLERAVCAVGSGSSYTTRDSSASVSDSRWHYIACTASGNTQNMVIYNDLSTANTLPTNAASAFTNSATAYHIGERPDNTNRGVQSLDEARVATDAKTANWITTTYNYQSGYQSTYQIVESSYSAPTIAQFKTCASPDDTIGVASCVMPFPITSTGLVNYTTAQVNLDCTTAPTDGLGLTLTQRITGDYTGTLEHYYNCQWTAPVTATGGDTITFPAGNVAAVVAEIKGATTTGIATAAVNNTSPVGAISATCSGTTCLLWCSENTTLGDTYGNSEGYSEIISPPVGPPTNAHLSQTYTANGLVSSGSQTCTITGTGQAGTLMLLPSSPSSSTVRHRIVNH